MANIKARTIRVLAFFLFLCVTAGADWRVKKVEFEGNETYSRNELLSLMEIKPQWPFNRIQYTDFVMQSDLDMLSSFYKNRGFRSVEVSTASVVRDSSNGTVEVTVRIDEGPRTHIKALRMLSRRSVLDSTLFSELESKAGEPLIASELKADVKKVKKILGYRGFLEADVEPVIENDTSEHLATIFIDVNEGPIIRVEDIRIRGNSTLARKVVQRELAFDPGDTLTLTMIERSERRLYRTGLFNHVQVQPVLDTTVEKTELPDSSYGVSVNVKQGDFFQVQAGFGYGSEEGFRTSVLSTYKNLFRQGHRLTVGGRASKPEQNAEVSYLTHWLLGVIPLQFETKLYYNRYDDPDLYRGIFDGLRLSLGRQTDYDIGFWAWAQWEEVQWVQAPASDTSRPEEVPENPTQSLGLSLDYDTRNDLFNPTRGLFSRVEAEVAGVYGGYSNQFVRLQLDTRWYNNYKSKLFFSSAFRTGWITPYGQSEAVPAQEKFYGGGSGTVRGFELNKLAVHPNGDPLKGNFYIMANLIDFRFPLFWWVQGALFLDAGYVWSEMEDISSFSGFMDDVRWTAGPGLRINTPLMMIRFDMGFKLDRRTGEALWEPHFDLGQPF
ncbi:MAG: outer membrane protein assembly factor BamA [Fibrobacterota bacterium]